MGELVVTIETKEEGNVAVTEKMICKKYKAGQKTIFTLDNDIVFQWSLEHYHFLHIWLLLFLAVAKPWYRRAKYKFWFFFDAMEHVLQTYIPQMISFLINFDKHFTFIAILDQDFDKIKIIQQTEANKV